MSINNTTEIVKYVLSSFGASFQLRYNQEAVTSLANSNAEPIKTTGQNAPIKMAARPMME